MISYCHKVGGTVRERVNVKNMSEQLRYRRLTAEKEIPNGIVDIKRKNFRRGYEPHLHDFFEIEIFTEGSGGKHIINGREYDIEPRCAAILTPSDLHEIRADSPFGSVTLMIAPNVLPPDLMTDILGAECVLTGRMRPERFETVMAMANCMLDEASHSRRYARHFLTAFSQLIAAEVMREICLGLSDENRRMNERGFDKVINYLMLHFPENPPLTKAAEYMGYNSSYFSKRFKQVYGVTYKEYLRGLKLSHAKSLLADKDLSLPSICSMSGYASDTVFFADFKKQFGETPTQYRRRGDDADKQT